MQALLTTAGIAVFVALFFAIWRRLKSGSDEGPVSIAILRGSHRGLTEVDVRGAVRRALKVEARIEPLPMPDGRSKSFGVLTKEFPPLDVIDAATLYATPQQMQKHGRWFEDPRAQRAFGDHNSWLSVDAMGIDKVPPKEIRAKMYELILGKVAAELLDDDSLLLYLPAEGKLGLPGPGVAEKLANGKVGEVFGDDALQEVVFHTKADDAAMKAAMAKARAAFPALIEAWNRQGESSVAMVKGAFPTADGRNEFMWIKVTGAADGKVTGELLNRPIDPSLPMQGSLVTLGQEQVADIAYTDENKQLHGMFVERLLLKG